MLKRLPGLLRRACLFILAVSAVAHSQAVNRTIDDEKGDSVTGEVPTYSPVGSWSQGSTCSGCFIQLDPSQTFDGTWHDSTHTPGDPEPRVITAHFTGTAVYVYNAIANTVPFTTTLTNLSFTLDGAALGQFVHTPSDSDAFQYDVPVFVRTGLKNTEHTIVIEATGDTNSSLVLFDYIVYTFEADLGTTVSAPTSPATSPNPPTTSPNPPTTSPNPPTTSPTTTPTTSQNPPTVSPNSSSTSLPLTASGNAVTSSGPTSLASPASSSGSSVQTSQSSDPGSANDALSQKGSTISAGAVAGGVIGGVAVVVAASVLALCFLRRRRRQAASSHTVDLGDPDPTETRATEGSAIGRGTTFFGSTAQSGFTSPFMDPAQASLASPFMDPVQSSFTDIPAMSSPSLHRVPPSGLGSSTDLPNFASFSPQSAHSGSTTPVSNPMSAHSGSSTGLLESGGSSVPSSVRRARPLPQPSTSDSGSSNGGDYAHTPSPLSMSQADILAVQPPSMYSGIAARRSLHLAGQPFPADVKSPLADSAAEPPSPTRTEPGTASSVTGTSTLRAQVAALQEEVERLREQRELQQLFDEAPPQYHEA